MLNSFIIILLFNVVLSACKSSGGKNPDAAVPTPPSGSCGQHEWRKSFNFLGKPLDGAYLKGNAWTERLFTIETSKIHGSRATETQDFVRSPECLAVSNALTSGVERWASDTEITIPGGESIKKGDIMKLKFGLKLAANDELPGSINDFKAEVLKGESPVSVTSISATLDIQLSRGASDFYIGSSFKDIKLDCTTPFNQVFGFKRSYSRSACRLKSDQVTYECLTDPSKTFAERDAVNGLCRIQKNARGEDLNSLECLEAQIDFTGDSCTISAKNIEILAPDNQKIQFGFDGTMQRLMKDGQPYYEWLVTNAVFK